MKYYPAFAAQLLLISALAVSAPAQQISTGNPSTVRPGLYNVEPVHTQISFSISHFGFSNFSGFFSRASGTLQLDPAHAASSRIEITVPIDSVLTTSAKLDEELKSSDWFDAGQYPVATFVSTKISPLAAGHATITGNLTLHGVTKPIAPQAALVGSGTNPLDKSFTVGFQATGIIKRSDFGVSKYLPLVGDEAPLNVAGAFALRF